MALTGLVYVRQQCAALLDSGMPCVSPLLMQRPCSQTWEGENKTNFFFSL